jgi:HK97 gp10 family phage protein
MSDEVSLSVQGLPELYAQLNEMVKSVSGEKVEDAFLVGAMTLQQAVKQAAPRGPTGNLIKDIKVKQLPQIGNAPKSAIVKSMAPHDHLVEFGSKPRYQKKTGRFTGSMPAHPFFRPAVDANKEAIYTQVIEDIKSAIDEVL